MSDAQVLKETIFQVQACVPDEWSNFQAESWLARTHPAGTERGWQVMKTEDPERVACAERRGFVHIVFAA